MSSGMREGRFEDVADRMTKKGGKNETGEAGEIKGEEADSEGGGFSVSEEQQQARRRRRREGSHRRHGKSLFPRTESGDLR